MLILENATLLDATCPELRPGHSVAIEGVDIKEVSSRTIRSETAQRIDLKGRTLLPGLIDAHYHPTLTETNPAQWRDVPATLMTARAAKILNASMMRGFTTVRDMGGGDWGLRAAVSEKVIVGPRMFIAGRAIAQTGGHGDLRSRIETDIGCGCSNSLAYLATVADGKAAVQHAAREQLRQGANHLKVFLSGGVFTNNVPLRATHFTAEELEAIVHEARAWGTYVGAHAYTPEAIAHAANSGVRTIEHGNFLDQKTAELLAFKSMFLVPTLSITYAIALNRARLNLTDHIFKKLDEVLEAGLASIEHAKRAGVRVGLGTDLFGDVHEYQSEEFTLRARVQSPYDVIVSATAVNAEIVQMPGRLGVIATGAIADLIAVDGNPLDDLGLLQNQGRHLALILKDGEIVKSAL